MTLRLKKYNKNRSLSLRNEKDVCTTDWWHLMFIFCHPVRHQTYILIVFFISGPSTSQYVNISASPSPCVSFHDISVHQFPSKAHFPQVFKTHLYTGVLLPFMEFWNPSQIDMYQRIRTGLILGSGHLIQFVCISSWLFLCGSL